MRNVGNTGAASSHSRSTAAAVRTLPTVGVMLLVLAWLLSSCDHGLAPVPERTSVRPGITGRITVTPPWPPADSLFDLRVVIFRTYPPIGILEEFLAGTLQFSDPLPTLQDTIRYELRADGLSGRFAYVVVAQQYGSNPFEQWRVVGVYTRSGDPTAPSDVDLASGNLVTGIDIHVDFSRLPPQPF